jgi:Uma2 family endonuclease
MLLLHPGARSRQSLPVPEDVLVLIDVAESSLAYDLKDKRQAYARAGIVEYWLLDLTKSQMDVFRDPSTEGYRSEKIVAADGSVASLAFPNEPIALSEILAP